MNNYHTKGPWAVCAGQSHFHVISERCGVDYFPRYVCRVQDDRVGRADASLIAAAPDLLEFAEFVASWTEGEEQTDAVIDLRSNARTAIAKARGEA